ncbi:hypothetical protein BGZ83_008519 [Gryganskiella cystojenkinii]|nr:hypothetical protein BGZ83_008519 [Gryganskiella cystojenkinii]
MVQTSSPHYQDERRVELNGPNNPMMIPEIVHMVFLLIDRETAWRHLTLCRLWYLALLPLIWPNIELLIQGDRIIPENHSGTLTHVRKHASFVRDLKIGIDLKSIRGLPLENARSQDRNILLQFQNLTALRILLRYDGGKLENLWDRQRSTSYLLSFLVNNNKKKSRSKNGKTDDHQVARPLQHLRELEVRDMNFQFAHEWMTFYEIVWSRLEILTLTGSWWAHDEVENQELQDFDKMRALEERVGPTVLREVTFETGSKNEALFRVQAWIIYNSPRLTRLRWSFRAQREGQEPLYRLQRSIRSTSRREAFRNLESLSFPRTLVDSRDFAYVVKNITKPLKELDLSETRFGREDWKNLRAEPRHLESLTVLNFQGCSQMYGTIVHDMMCLLPNLEVLKAPAISDKEIQSDPEDRPWACLRLKELQLSFRFPGFSLKPLPPGISRHQIVIPPRLATLEQLEVLHLECSGLVLNLDYGGCLADLGSLRRLRELSKTASSYSFYNDFRQRDVDWMRERWVELKYVNGFTYHSEIKDPFPTR